MSALDKLALMLAKDDDAAADANEPAEGTYADLTEDMEEALSDLQDAIDGVKEVFAQVKAGKGLVPPGKTK